MQAECIVARENHSTGEPHLHVFVDFGRKRRIRDARKFDVQSRHPNVEPSRGRAWDGYDYVIKEGNVVAGGLERPEPEHGRVRDDESIWTQLVGCEDRDSFFEPLRSDAPKCLITQFTQVQRYADWNYGRRQTTYEQPPVVFNYEGIGELPDWSSKLGHTVDGEHGGGPQEMIGRKSIVIYGPSKTGKTLWARSHGCHAYFNGLFSGKEAIRAEQCEYAVFDDMQGGIKFFHGWKQWLGSMHQFQVKQLYRDPVIITWGKPSIWLSNKDPREDLTEQSDIDWMEVNCTFVYIAMPFVTFYLSCQ
uniref:Replication-associated protein n=1 Tax=Red panda feces-associated genomovirus TaxID=2863991 RepID=A0A8K1HKR0_9VIRU|nr:replication-associated protein [Red panda feces-associated genomovirus]